MVGWLRLDPWLLGAGGLLAPVALLVRRVRPAAVALLVSVAVLARPGYRATRYQGDKAAGDLNGEGLNDKWYVVDAEGKQIK